MKVTAELVKQFKKDMKRYGVMVALKNLLWLNADAQMRDLGVKQTKTKYRKGR